MGDSGSWKHNALQYWRSGRARRVSSFSDDSVSARMRTGSEQKIRLPTQNDHLNTVFFTAHASINIARRELLGISVP